jgi:hypothetical protein
MAGYFGRSLGLGGRYHEANHRYQSAENRKWKHANLEARKSGNHNLRSMGGTGA